MTRTRIAGGQVVSSNGTVHADVLIDGERIAAVAEPAALDDVPVQHRIDATGMYVLPGGVDVHTHMEMPQAGTVTADSFASGTRAAAWGGTTTIIDFAVQRKGEIVQECLAEWHDKARGHCHVDYGFHQILGDVTPEALKSLDDLVSGGVTSVKLFMAYPGVFQSDDNQILQVMRRAHNAGVLVMVHAENGDAADFLAREALARGERDHIQHALTRPPEIEGEATARAIALARLAGKAPLYLVHLSCSQALDAVVAARRHAEPVFAETCPHYLFLNLEDQVARPGPDGASLVCSPPLRSRADGHSQDLWNGLRAGALSVVSTDHCPFCTAERSRRADRADFTAIPNGIAGIEHRMCLLFQGVARGTLSPARWVELCCTDPAIIFGLHPRKGAIVPGADADIVLFDPTGTTPVSAATHHMNVNSSVYEGMVLDGRVDTVLLRGSVVLSPSGYAGVEGQGRFLRRNRFKVPL